MVGIHEEIDPTETIFERSKSDSLEQRGRLYKLPMRHEYSNKNIQFKGTVASNANELLRTKSQLSRNSSAHSHTMTGTRNNSITNILLINNPAVYPNTKSLLSTYNDKVVSDTVLPAVRQLPHQQQQVRPQLSRLSSRGSSNHSLKRNYTFRSESQSRLREREESIVGGIENEHTEYNLELEVRKRFNKAASISGPIRRAHELKKSSLNHSYNASSESSMYSLEEEDENSNRVVEPMSFDSIIPISADNLFPKDLLMHQGSSDSTSQLPGGNEKLNEEQQPHDQPMRTLQRQMNIRDQLLLINNDEQHTNDLAQKWNNFVSIDDRRMFELITNDLRKIARYSQRPVPESLNRCVANGSLKLTQQKNETKKMNKFDLKRGREQVKLYWKELHNDKTATTDL